MAAPKLPANIVIQNVVSHIVTDISGNWLFYFEVFVADEGHFLHNTTHSCIATLVGNEGWA